MSAKESGNVLRKAEVEEKYERNPVVVQRSQKRRLCRTAKRREWETRGMYPETGQALMEKYVGRRGRM